MDSDSALCQKPDMTKQSCLQGQGNCGGYGPIHNPGHPYCNCTFLFAPPDGDPNGCIVSYPAPANSACWCRRPLNPNDPCLANLVSCADPDNFFCKHPSILKESCLQGKGDCRGYYPPFGPN